MANTDDGGGGGEGRRVVRHRWKHHRKSVPPPAPNPWPDADGSAGRAVGRLLQHDRNGTAPQQRAQHDGAPPATMCYTTNEVLVIIAVTCFLNFAFILLVMTCVHCFTEPSHHKKFGAVAYAELGDAEQLFDADAVDGDAVTLLNPTREWPDGGGGGGQYDPESCGPYSSSSLIAAHDRRPRRKSRRRRSADGPVLFLFE